MRTSSKQEAKPMMRFASPWPVTIACARYRSSAAVAIAPLQHVNATVSDILIMARTTPGYIKCGRRFVVCRVTTLISCCRCDARAAIEGAVAAHVTAPPPQKPSATPFSYPYTSSPDCAVACDYKDKGARRAD